MPQAHTPYLETNYTFSFDLEFFTEQNSVNCLFVLLLFVSSAVVFCILRKFTTILDIPLRIAIGL